MPLLEPEKLVANIVVVTSLDAVINFSLDDVKPILRDAQIQLVGPQQPQLTSLREQVVVAIIGNHLVFEDQSGEGQPKPRLPEIVEGFVGLLQQKGISRFIAYGFNFDIAFDASGDAPAAQVIRDRFVKADKLSQRGLQNVEGAGLRLYYRSSEAKCELRIEPLGNQSDTFRFFAHINYHYELSEDQSIPALDTLRSDFLGKWSLFTQDLERLLIT